MTQDPANTPDHEVLIIGTGFAGLGAAIQLGRAGFHDYVLIEKEPEVGGTWLVNTYPGCACDVESHMYSFSFEQNPSWSRAFAAQPEILAYLRRVAEKYGLRPRMRFGTQVVSLRYDERRCWWEVALADAQQVRAFVASRGLKPGDPLPSESPDFPEQRVLRARCVVAGLGGLSTPAYPELAGLSRFRGKAFHSQRWDHGYDLKGKRVAVIGTGASAIQFVPAIQPQVGKLDVYQRTPPWVLPKPDRAMTGPEKWLFRHVPPLQSLRRLGLYLRMEVRAVAFVVKPELAKLVGRRARAYIQEQVPDPVLREKLTPHYDIGCKRVLLADDWYSSLQKPNVELITQGIREVREHTIVDAAGVERPADCLIYGTGFRVSNLVPPGTIFGKEGRDVTADWASGPEAYKGTMIAGCPNLFLISGPNTGIGHNSVVYMIESQLRYVVDALKWMRRHDLVEIDVKREVQDQFNRRIRRRSRGTIWESGGCTSYYLDPNTGRNFALWPGFTFGFRAMTRHFDAQNYHQRRAPQAAPERRSLPSRALRHPGRASPASSE